jgi:hypothetical protein
VVRRVLGCEVEHFDDGSAGRQGAVDALIRQAGAEIGALEVTVVANPAVMAVESVLVGSDRDRFDGLRWTWMVRPGVGIRFEEFDQHLEVLLRACEAQDQQQPYLLAPRDAGAFAARDWYVGADIEISCLGPPSTGAGAVDVLPPTMSGAVDEQLEGMALWVGETLGSEPVSRRVAKLGAAGLEERHLYLIVHWSGMAFPTYCGLTFEATVPPVPPPLPDAVTHLWIDGAFRSGGVLRWAPDGGWSRHHPYD